MKAYFLCIALSLPFLMAANNGQRKKPHFHQVNQSGGITLGAYYFDGWANTKSGHLTPKLRDSFPDRKPKWGWITSTPDAMKDQIDLAADAGLSFFSFDWYYPDYDHQHFREDPLNHALSLYLAAPNKGRLKFCLLIANHAGQEIGPSDWPAVTDEWVRLMGQPGYLKVSGKPYLSFFSVGSLIKMFGSKDAVHTAMEELRNKARQAGQPGVTVAGCVSPNDKSIQEAKDCGFDVVTGYNYPNPSYRNQLLQYHVDSLASVGKYIWNIFRHSSLPYIPVATLNWDPRPWANGTNFYSRSTRFTGYNANTVYKAVTALKDWINDNPGATPRERIGMLYAWNEYGEGAWLTPSQNDTLHLLSGVKRALSH
ncbi:MAG TPA: glycoside hydrolase family 99-like domain-containing protein [Puia sp.]|nr:glycoside hydrolase family 99-like domain-containing protein [Puia sp.]